MSSPPFTVFIQVDRKTFDIPYSSVDECEGDRALRALFELGAKAYVRCGDVRVTRDVESFDELLAHLRRNVRLAVNDV